MAIYLILSTVGSKLTSISKELHPLCIVECSVDDGNLYHPKSPGFAHDNIGETPELVLGWFSWSEN